MIYQKTWPFTIGRKLTKLIRIKKMRKFEIRVTRLATERYIILAHNEQEAEEIAIFGDLDPHAYHVYEERIDTEEVHEGP